MLYQPTFPSPYLETIDVTNPAGNIFKCLINPKNKVIGYKINILSNIDSSLCCSIKGWLEDVEGVQVQKKAYSVDEGVTWIELEIIPEEDSILPVVGSFSDESWLQVLLPSNIELNISNDSDYKWNITLEQEKYDIKIVSGTVHSAGKYVDTRDIYMEVSKYIKVGNLVSTKTKGENIESSIITELFYYNSSGERVNSADDASYIYAHVEGFQYPTVIENSYVVYANYITSYDYFFKARKTPVLTFDVPDTVSSLSYTFTAELNKPNIAYYKFDLYLGSELIATSKDIYSNHISYTYDGFITGNKYSVVLTIETEDKEIITQEREFLVSYNISYSTILVETEMDKSINGVVLDYSSQVTINGSTNVVYYKIQRKNVKENIMRAVANVDKSETKVIDFNIGNKATYKYYITPVIEADGKEVTGQTIETDEFNTEWCSWSVIGLKTIENDVYEIDDNNIWIFHLNLEPGDYKPVYSKTFTQGMGRFPKGFSGETNYIKGSLSCYIGEVDKFGDYCNDDVVKNKKWAEFCNNDEMKLLRDVKGNVFLVDIEDTSMKVENYVNGMPTKISFNFIQLGDAEHVCVYKAVSE